MRIIKLILLIFLFIPYIGKAGTTENLFTVQSGKIVSKPSFITPLHQQDAKLIGALISTEKIVSKDNSSEYQVSLYDYGEYASEGDPGAYRFIKIKKGNKELLKLLNIEAWDTIPRIFTHGALKYFLEIPLTAKMTALLFVGYTFPDSPGFVTIIVLNGEEATLVYNKAMYPIEITNSTSAFSAYIANGFVQYLDDDKGIYKMDTETLPFKYHIWSENGLLKLQNLGKVTEDFLE